jgi:hypothetical protein
MAVAFRFPNPLIERQERPALTLVPKRRSPVAIVVVVMLMFFGTTLTSFVPNVLDCSRQTYWWMRRGRWGLCQLRERVWLTYHQLLPLK